MIDFRDVVITYAGAPSPAVNGVSLSCPRAGVTAVVGPNGSGKSTLVRALLGRQPLTSGAIAIDDRLRQEFDQREFARTVAVVPQREEPAFPMSVGEYVTMGRLPHGSAWGGVSAADMRAVSNACLRTNIGEFIDRSTDQLSGGEWQRVRVARALAQDAQALVLDEPTTFLDIAHEMELFELAASLADAGLAVLLVSHQLNLVARFAHEIVLLEEGRVAASGPPGTVLDARTLERVYGWPLVVASDPASGAPSVIPLRRRSTHPH
jgi:iron complex transport system ATP-binding protein